jgi:hypothetical protein
MGEKETAGMEEAKTVKGSKSNTSEQSEAPGETARATTVKSSKSNSSD